jgi:colanic acid/amylovoran biosynthesis glycosyltransferase
MHITYLVNQYPKVSHSFIRREILALEKNGFTIQRTALRGWEDDTLVDEQDREELKRTAYVLKQGISGVALAMVAMLLRAPVRFVTALRLAARMGWRAERPLAYHLIYFAEACVVARWMQQSKSQHLHAHFGTNPATVGMLAGALSNRTYSFTAHGPEEFDKPKAIHLDEKIRRASFVVAISSFGRSQLYRCVEAAQWSKIQVVHCGLDSEFKSEPAHQLADPHRIVCVGRLCEQKGQLLLVQAIRQVIDRGLQIGLVLAGDGEMRRPLEQMIKELDLGRYVRITGWISGAQVREELLNSRALVLPSFAEGLPVVIMEAMALGRPVISTYVAGVPELVGPKETGWLVPAGDVAALTDAICECLNASQAELAAMGKAARGRALLRHDVDTEAAKLGLLFMRQEFSLDVSSH